MQHLPTLSFKVESQRDKDLANDIIEEYAKSNKLNKGEAVIHLLVRFQEQLEGGQIEGAYVPPNVQEVLDEVRHKLGCQFLKFMENDFYCLEKIAKTKKPVMLRGSPEDVLDMCRACDHWTEEQKQAKLEALRNREYIKRLENFMKGLITISERGFITDVQFCVREVMEGNLVFSRDGRTLNCPLEDGDVVYIEEKCQTMLNPKDGVPPCQYFATIEKLVQLDKSVWESHDLKLPALTVEDDLPDPLEPRRVVDSEVKEIDE